MNEKHAILMGEIRYAERLTQRTARLYRRAATLCTFIGVLGGGSLMASVASGAPDWLRFFGLLLLAVAGAAAVAVRPLEKAITNESDARKYATLRTQGLAMDEIQLEAALQKARESDTAEIELLRDVAFNDLLVEIGRDELVQPLSTTQKLLSAVA
jgi:hypothetical protein